MTNHIDDKQNTIDRINEVLTNIQLNHDLLKIEKFVRNIHRIQIERNRQYFCHICQKEIIKTPLAKKPKYCSPACKQKAYRQRKQGK